MCPSPRPHSTTAAAVHVRAISGPALYRYNCHTCKVHFPDDPSLSTHLFRCHRPLRFDAHAAGKTQRSSQQSPGATTRWGHPPEDPSPQPCTRPRCACPRFTFADEPAATHGRVFDGGGGGGGGGCGGGSSSSSSGGGCGGGGSDDDDDGNNIVANLDGAAGSSMRGQDPDDFNGRDDAEEIKVSVSGDRGDRDMNKRFNKGKKGLKYKVRHEGADRDLKVLRAYEDADEILFGQRRFEELEDGEEIDERTNRRDRSRPVTYEGHKALRLTTLEEKERIDLWKEGSGIRNLQKEREKEERDLAASIDKFIADTMAEVKSKEQQRRDALLETRKQNRLRFDDMVEDVALDHLQEVEERIRETERKRLGAKQTRALALEFWDDIVDEVAYDHLQEVAEREEEHNRKILGRAQQRRLAAIRADDAIDNVVMDFLQENAERQREIDRKALGRKQQRELNDMAMDDIVDGMVMDHLQENAERQQESYRRAIGRKQQREHNDMAFDDIVDGMVMDHLQENAERQQESYRKAIGRKQQRALNDMAMDDIVDGMVMNHLQENAERQQESYRKAIGRKQQRELDDMAFDDIVDGMVMDHLQENAERQQESDRKALGRKQGGELHTMEMDDIIDGVVMDHLQEIAERTEQDKRLHAGREVSRKIAQDPAAEPKKQKPPSGDMAATGKGDLKNAETSKTERKSTDSAAEPDVKKRRRGRNPKQNEYDAMVDEMVRLQEAKKARF